MKIFVGFGYRPEDAWVRTLVFPMIQAFDSTVVTGERLWGEGLSEQINALIAGCDGFIGFLTRRDDLGQGRYNTHQWVVQEAASARQAGLKVLEVREEGVDPQLGMMFDLQRIRYTSDKRDACISELARVLIEWHSEFVVQPQVSPPEIISFIRRHRKDHLRCEATVLRDRKRLPPVLVEHIFVAGGEGWESPFTPVDALLFHFEKMT
jgi:hypothetical protein